MIKYRAIKLIAWSAAFYGLQLPLLASAACTGGTTAAWQTEDPGGHLHVNDTAAMKNSNCGLEIRLDGTDGPNGKRYVQDSTPSQETRYRARFYFDPNGVDIAADDSEKLKFSNQQQQSNSALPIGVAQMKLKRDASGYVIRAWARWTRPDGSGGKKRVELPLEDGPNIIEIELIIGKGNGAYRIWINNGNEAVPNFEATQLDNAAYGGIDRARLGYLGGNFAPVGSIFIDEFVSTRSSFIGP
ncbi:hypothetical protein [Nitrosococcus oceani]|nr:hypothetical protein [Nitrosococcus oceani]GEM20120.1 hypothetical protein NONS58_15270 [Nitrosococcus oceani]